MSGINHLESVVAAGGGEDTFWYKASLRVVGLSRTRGGNRAVSVAKFDRYILDEILGAASRTGVALQELSSEVVTQLRSELSDKFGDGEHLLTFENMKYKAARQDENGWRRLTGFLDSRPHIIFYDAPGAQDRGGVLVPDGSKIPMLIAECFGFPFYVTDAEHTFVVGMNDHDFLIGTGTAANWITNQLGVVD